MSKQTFVSNLPQCDFCPEEAHYDGKTVMGYWANMCPLHFRQYGTGLGTGRGQELVVRPVAAVETAPGTFEQSDTSAAAFDSWMEKVNRSIELDIGLSALDLGDRNYRGWFEDGMAPSDAAAEVVAEEMDEMGMGEMGFDW